MNLKSIGLSFACILPFTISFAFADFPRDADLLARDARRLADEVSIAAEPEPVSGAAQRMDTEAQRLFFCARQYPGTPTSGPERLPGCQREVREVQLAYDWLERATRGVQLTMPVARQLQRLRYSIQPFLQNPPPRLIGVNGSIDGFAYDFDAYDFNGIHAQCMNFGYTYRIRFVREFWANGSWYAAPYGRAWYLSDACRLIASRAY